MNVFTNSYPIANLFSAICVISFTLFGCATAPDPNLTRKTPQALIAEEIKMENAIIAGDARMLAKRIDEKFEFVHGEGWRDGGQSLLTEERSAWLESVKEQNYLYRILDSVRAEVWGNTGLTHGHYKASRTMPDESLLTFDVWYIRLYEFREGEWVWLKHLSVDGPNRQ